MNKNKDIVIGLRMTTEQRDILRRNAHKLEMNVSEYVRALCIDQDNDV